MTGIFLWAGCLGCHTRQNALLLFSNTSKSPKMLIFGFWTTKICLQWFGQKKIKKGLLRRFFGLKFDLRILGRPELPIPFFGVFPLPAPTLVMTKDLRTFAGPQNTQKKNYYMYKKKGSNLKIFNQILIIHSGSPF